MALVPGSPAIEKPQFKFSPALSTDQLSVMPDGTWTAVPTHDAPDMDTFTEPAHTATVTDLARIGTMTVWAPVMGSIPAYVAIV